MGEQYTTQFDEKPSTKLYHFIQEIWPKIYKTFNDFLMGTISFVIDTLGGLWRRY